MLPYQSEAWSSETTIIGRTTVVTNPADIVVGRRHTVNLVGRFT